jgi:hypothetical protein
MKAGGLDADSAGSPSKAPSFSTAYVASTSTKPHTLPPLRMADGATLIGMEGNNLVDFLFIKKQILIGCSLVSMHSYGCFSNPWSLA